MDRVWSITYDLEREEFIWFRFNSELESESLTFVNQLVVPRAIIVLLWLLVVPFPDVFGNPLSLLIWICLPLTDVLDRTKYVLNSTLWTVLGAPHSVLPLIIASVVYACLGKVFQNKLFFLFNEPKFLPRYIKFSTGNDCISRKLNGHSIGNEEP